jgi:tetratricopeptide (TPR) repeat protein
LEYLFAVDQWVDGTPDGLNVGELCAALNDALSRPRPPAEDLPPANPEAQQQVLRTLAAEMVRRGQVRVPLRLDGPAARAAVRWLRSQRQLRTRPLADDGQTIEVAPATAAVGRRVLAQWVAEQAALSPAELLGHARRFRPLVAGIADHLAQSPAALETEWTARLLAADTEVLGQVVAETVRRSSSNAGQSAVQSSNGSAPLLQAVVRHGSQAAARGLLQAARQALDDGQYELAEACLSALDDWIAAHGAAAAARLRLEAAAERGRLLLRCGEPAQAEERLRAAFDEARRLNRRPLLGSIANSLARAILDGPRPTDDREAEAIRVLREAVPLLGGADCRRQLAAAYCNLGDALADTDPDAAEAYFRRDVAICRQSRDDGARIDALDRLGVFLAGRNRFDEAAAAHAEAVRLCARRLVPRREARVLANQGRCFFRQGYMHRDRRKLLAAVRTLRRSCTLFSTLREPRLHAPTLENLGRALWLLKRYKEGAATLERAAAEYERWAAGCLVAAELRNELMGLLP